MAERGGYDPNMVGPDGIPGSPAARESERARMERVYQRRRRALGGVGGLLLAALAAAGLSAGNKVDKTDIEPVGGETTTQTSEQTRLLEIDSLRPGQEVSYYRGIVELDLNKLNLRDRPMAIQDNAGTSNKIKVSEDSMIVINPIYVESNEDGAWFRGYDAEGHEFNFAGNVGHITSVETGQPVSLGQSSIYSENGAENTAKIVATTSSGVAARTESGEELIVGTVTRTG
ncbi:hypothetical protein IT414_01900 [bacterium]|nr:hypothetical protein [bacterium]